MYVERENERLILRNWLQLLSCFRSVEPVGSRPVIWVRAGVAVLSLSAGSSGRFSVLLSRGKIPSQETSVLGLKAFN